MMHALYVAVMSVAVLAPAPRSASFAPPAVLEPKAGYAIYLPPDDVKSAVYVALDGEEPFPIAEVGGSATAFVFPTRGLAPKNYRFVGVASDKDGNLTRKEFAVPVGTVPPKNPPVTPPKVDPPAKTDPAATYYFLIVRPDGPAAPMFTANMRLPAWEKLRAAGHLVKDYTVKDAAKAGYTVPDGTPLPVVVTLKETETNSAIVRGPIAMPTTEAAILDLPKGVK